MGKNELYVLIAVFVLLTVIIVWFGAKCINDIRNRKNNKKSAVRSGRPRSEASAKPTDSVGSALCFGSPFFNKAYRYGNRRNQISSHSGDGEHALLFLHDD